VKLHEIVEEYATLRAEGKRLVAHCPFHDDHEQSFSVYPETNTYACSVCGVRGDVVQFLMDKESMTFGQALDALERSPMDEAPSFVQNFGDRYRDKPRAGFFS
jgi:DNA primase